MTPYILSRRITTLSLIAIVSVLTSLSTLSFQTITQNRLLSPAIMGFDQIYLLIQTTMIVIGIRQSSTAQILLSVFIMVSVMMSLYHYILVKKEESIYILLLLGMILTTFASSLTQALEMILDPNEFSIVQDRAFASINSYHAKSLLVLSVIAILGLWVLYRLKKYMSVLVLGDDLAANLGVNVDKVKRYALYGIALCTSVSTALIGPISFLGLLSVNIARQHVKSERFTDVGKNSVLMSMILLLGTQVIFERVMNFNSSLTVVLNFCGGLYFFYLIMKERFND
ncbi:iron chelate uptake ABC transporter family permease subunit [Erysipelothrix urinaevulpis]